MNGRKLGVFGYVGTAGLAAALLIAGCGPDYHPPLLGENKLTCECDCQTGNSFPVHSLETWCTSISTIDDAVAECDRFCTGDQGTVCTTTNTVLDMGGCASTMPSGQVVSSGGDPTSTEVTIDPSFSVATVHHFGSMANPTFGGVMEFKGGCETGTCQLLFSRIVLTPDNFSLTVGGLPIDVENVTIESIGTIHATQVDGEFTIKRKNLAVLVNGDVEGSHHVEVVTPDQPISGFYLPSTGMFGLSGTFSLSEDVSLEFSFETTVMSRAPLADRGPSAVRVVHADPSGYASVLLDGTGSSDLDYDLTFVEWYEGTTYLGSIAPSVNFSTGVHHVTVYAMDATEKWSSENIMVIVVPPQGGGKP